MTNPWGAFAQQPPPQQYPPQPQGGYPPPQQGYADPAAAYAQQWQQPPAPPQQGYAPQGLGGWGGQPQGYGPPPGAYGPPPGHGSLGLQGPPPVTGSLADFYSQATGGGRILSFAVNRERRVGIGHIFIVSGRPTVQQATDMTTKAPKFRSGRPLWEMWVNGIEPQTQEAVTWICKGKAKDSLNAAMAEAGSPVDAEGNFVVEDGAVIFVRLEALIPTKGVPMSEYMVKYWRSVDSFTTSGWSPPPIGGGGQQQYAPQPPQPVQQQGGWNGPPPGAHSPLGAYSPPGGAQQHYTPPQAPYGVPGHVTEQYPPQPQPQQQPQPQPQQQPQQAPPAPPQFGTLAPTQPGPGQTPQIAAMLQALGGAPPQPPQG